MSEALIRWGSVGALGVAIGWLSLRLPEGAGGIAIGLLLALIALVTVGARLASEGEILAALLVVSFVLTGWRTETGFIVIEPSQVVMALCFGAWALEALRRGRWHIYLDGVGWCALFVVVAAWMSYFGALDSATWFKRAMRVTSLFGVYMYLVTHVRSHRSLITVVRCCLLASAIASVTLLWQALGRLGGALSFEDADLSFLNGTFANTNEGATYIAMFAVFGVALLLSRVDREVMPRWALRIVLGLVVLAIIFGGSRTGTLALVVVSAGMFILHKRGGRMKRFGLVGVLGATALIVFLTSGVASNFFFRKFLAMFGASGDPDYDAFVQSGMLVRLHLLRVYWSVATASPVFGIGGANYEFMGELDLDLPPPPEGAGWGFENTERYLGFSSHNGFINWLAETGVVGFLPFLGSLLIAIVVLRRLSRRPDASLWWRAVAIGMLGAVSVFVITNLAGDFAVSEARYWLLLALTTITLRQSRV